MASQIFNCQNLGVSRLSFLGKAIGMSLTWWDIKYIIQEIVPPLRSLGCDEFYEYMWTCEIYLFWIALANSICSIV
jgi:hypothetical protein